MIMNTEEFKLTSQRLQREQEEFANNICHLIKQAETVEQKAQEQYAEGYQKGLEDAWELAGKVTLLPSEEGMTAEEILECFNVVNELCVLRSPVSVAKEMYDTWKAKKEQQKDDEIHVGDEVRWNHMYELMVVVKKVNDHYGLIHLSDGSYDNSDGCHLVKTGKHYDLPWLKECQ